MEREEFLLLIIDLPVFMNVDDLSINGVGFGQLFGEEDLLHPWREQLLRNLIELHELVVLLSLLNGLLDVHP